MTKTQPRLQAKHNHKDFITYDPIQGSFMLKKEGCELREVYPNDNGYILYGHEKKLRYVRACVIAYEIFNSCVIPSNHKILFKDLDMTNLKANNLGLVSAEEYKEATQALRNLSNIKLKPHPHDKHSYILTYNENGMRVRKVIFDVVVAKRELIKLKVKFTKVVSKYFYLD